MRFLIAFLFTLVATVAAAQCTNVTSLAATGVGSSNATISFTTPSASTFFVIKYNGIRQNVNDPGGPYPKLVTAPLSGLSASTGYTVSVVRYCTVTDSTETSTISFTTTAGACDTVTNMVVTSTNVSATINSLEATYGTSYQLKYVKVGYTDTVTLSGSTADFSLSGLRAGSTYYYKITTICASGTAATSWRTFITKAVTNLTILNGYGAQVDRFNAPKSLGFPMGAGAPVASPDKNDATSQYMDTLAGAMYYFNPRSQKWFSTQLTVNVKDFGAKGDGITDDKPAFEAAANFVANKGGGTVFVPAASVYYRDTLPIYWPSNVNIVGEGDKSVIYNDRDTTTSSRAYPYVPIYFGEMIPICYDSTNLRFYSTGLASFDKVKVSSTIMDSFTVGNLVEIRGLTGFIGADGSTKPHVFRIEKIVKKILPDTLVLEHPLDTTLTTGKIAVMGKYLPTATKAIDEYGHPFYMIENINVENIRIKSNSEAFLRYAAYKADFRNVTVEAASLINCNAMSWNNWTNIRGTFWSQAMEFAMGSNNTNITNITGTYVKNKFLVSTVQPFIRYGENVFNIKVRNVMINAGESDRQGVAFDEAVNCSLENFYIDGKKLAQKVMEFSAEFYGSINRGNVARNGVIIGGTANSSLQFNHYHVDSSVNENNLVENVRFMGVINSSFAYRAGGTNNTIKDCYFEYGKGSTDDNISNFRIMNTRADGVYDRLTNVTQANNFYGTDNTARIWTDSKNISIGDNLLYNSGPGNANATGNFVAGNNAFQSVNTAKYNFAIGDSTLFNNADGENNIAIGYAALKNYLNNNSIGIGYYAGNAATTSVVTAIGSYALSSATGAFNTGIGLSAGRRVTTGVRVTAIGVQAFDSATTATDLIGIGVNIGRNITTQSNATLIGNNINWPTGFGQGIILGNNAYFKNGNTTNDQNPGNARFGLNIVDPLAYVHIPASTTAYPSIMFNEGVDPTVTLSGMIGLHARNSHLYARIGSTNYQLDQQAATTATVTGSGNGSSTAISITLPTSATWAMVGAGNAAAAGITYWTVSGTTLTINYAVAPASGTNNLSYFISYK